MGYPHTLRAELHKALSDAGIEYWVAQGITFWDCDDGRECLAYGYEDSDGTPSIVVKVVGIRDPQQAIDMTVGAGTCKPVSQRERDNAPYLHDEIVCSACGCQLAHPLEHVWQHFCPNCGKRIAKEEAE